MWGYILLALVAAGAYYYYVFLPKQLAMSSSITIVGPPQKLPPVSKPVIIADPKKEPVPGKTPEETAADLAAIAAMSMLNTGEFLTSDSSGGKGNKLSNGNFSLRLQADGNLCASHNETGVGSCTLDVSASGGPFKAILQPDGNFVVYNSGGGAAWASGTQNRNPPATQVIINQDGSWQINDSQGVALFKK